MKSSNNHLRHPSTISSQILNPILHNANLINTFVMYTSSFLLKKLRLICYQISAVRGDWMKENNLFGRLFLIQTKDLFESNNICLIQAKYLWAKWIFVWIFLKIKLIIISLYGERCNLFVSRQKLIWFKKFVIYFKDTLFELNTFYFIQINHFLN